MSTNMQNTDLEKEIDFGQISKKVENIYSSFWNKINSMILFAKRNFVWVCLLFVLGVALGFFYDRSNRSYDHEIVVIPNFGTADYLYSKIAILEAKIKVSDTMFLHNLGIKNASKLRKIEVEPINDIYTFINVRAQNFEFVKLMAEDGDVTKIIEDPVTSKNYSFHKISIKTSGDNSKEGLIDPILKFLNSSDYYAEIQKSVIASINLRIKADETTINLIDSLLSDFSTNANRTMKNDKMIYYNENTQLNEVLKTKNDLIYEVSQKKIELINSQKIVKESQVAINIKDAQSIFTKGKFLFPILLVALFVLIGTSRKKQA